MHIYYRHVYHFGANSLIKERYSYFGFYQKHCQQLTWIYSLTSWLRANRGRLVLCFCISNTHVSIRTNFTPRYIHVACRRAQCRNSIAASGVKGFERNSCSARGTLQSPAWLQHSSGLGKVLCTDSTKRKPATADPTHEPRRYNTG